MTGIRGIAHVVFLAGVALSASVVSGETLTINARRRIPSAEAPGAFRMVNDRQAWPAEQTAIIICDMWNRHWCRGATARVKDMAPAMNRVVSLARDRGILIVHAPSSCMEAYGDDPARQRAREASQEGLPDWLARWNNGLESEKGATWPIDQSDGGCDCRPQCPQGSPWTSQINTIDIREGDVISDSGLEIAAVLRQRGVRNVILMGVHTNMCVIGRPFGLRNMARWGMNVVLMRDLTDTMYNSRRPPYVDHFAGTSRIVEYIETYVCPTISSTDLTGRPPFRFASDHRPKAVFIIAEREYRSEQRLPEFARLLEDRHHIACDFALGIAQADGPERHRIENLHTLRDADLAVVFVRRRALPDAQMDLLHAYLDRGGPLIGIRTASHAFDARGPVRDPAGGLGADGSPKHLAQWPGFDAEVLGCKYTGHYGNTEAGTQVTPASSATSHPILAGLSPQGFVSKGTLYRSSPLADSAVVLLNGRIAGQEPEPVAWTHRYKNAKVFTTSLGHWEDWPIDDFERLMVNAVHWALE